MPPAPIEPSGSVKFDDQTFLISYFSQINREFPNPPSFSNCYKLNNNTTIPMSHLISIFNGTSDISSFLKLNTYQYSALVPKIRLYRVEYDSSGAKKADKEFIFDKDYKFEITDILKSPKRSNSGIKRINWRLAGSNPVTAEKQVEIDIELYFDSISSFSSGDFDAMKRAWTSAVGGYDPSIFSEFDTETTTRNYWSLLFHPKKGDNQFETTASARNKYDTKFFRIRANVGWENIESNVKNQIFSDVDINEEIDKLNYSFLLNLVEHKFTFNEDGSLVVTATYIATFENATHNYDFNLLGNLKKDLESMKNTSIGSLFDAYVAGTRTYSDVLLQQLSFAFTDPPPIDPITGRTYGNDTPQYKEWEARRNSDPLEPVNILKSLEESPSFQNLSEEERKSLIQQISDLTLNDLNEVLKIYNDPNTLSCLSKTGLNLQSDFASVPEILPASLPLSSPQGRNTFNESFTQITSTLTDKVNEIIQISSERKRQQYYKKLFEKLIESENIKTIFITRQQKELWEKWINGGAIVSDPYTPIDGIQVEGRAELAKTRVEYGQLTDNFFRNFFLDQLEELQKLSQADDKIIEKLKNAGTEFGEGFYGINYDKQNDRKFISFITLGHIIGSSIDIIKENLPSNSPEQKDLSRQIILCGNLSNDSEIISISENASDSSNTSVIGNRNLLDVPIDIKLLKLFLIENIVKPQKDTYSLFSFIKDIITKLVTGVLNGSNLYNSQTDVYSDTSLATNIFSLGNNLNVVDPMVELLPSIETKQTNILKNNIKKYYINNINVHNDYYNYFLIYDKKFVDFYPNKTREEDENMGIYRFTVGEDVGLLKSINFSRIDTPYLKEAKAVGKETFYLGQFRDRYNAELNMVGNNIYYPGMMLYIQPSVEAIQSDDKQPEINPSFAQITGIGGYYFVEKVDSTISEEGYETKLSCIWQYDGSEKPSETVDGKESCGIIFSSDKAKKLFNTILLKATNDTIIKSKQKSE